MLVLLFVCGIGVDPTFWGVVVPVVWAIGSESPKKATKPITKKYITDLIILSSPANQLRPEKAIRINQLSAHNLISQQDRREMIKYIQSIILANARCNENKCFESRGILAKL